jgi:hypothetical protein
LEILNYEGGTHMKKKIEGIFVCMLLIAVTFIPVSGIPVAGNIKIEPASSLMAIDTSVDDISPYKIYFSPLTITATGPSDLVDVELFYRWSSDNVSWGGYTEFSIHEGFESGEHNASLWSILQLGNNARIQWDYGNSQSGVYSCAMDDDDTYQGSYALNVIYTNYDFTGATSIDLEFWEREWGDENHGSPPPHTWQGWGYYDTVAFTNDGITWYEIVSESSLNVQTFTQFNVEIGEDPDFSSPANSNFAIAFQQYDNVRLTQDGRAWDEIRIDWATGAPSNNWMAWDAMTNPDTSYPWSWNFDFPNGTGYYEFYSIGSKVGEDPETPPINADALCRFNRKPEIFDENPASGSTGVQIIPQLSNVGVGNGTYSQNNTNFSNYGATYWWYVTVNDGVYVNSSPIFYFSTADNLPPYTPSNPDPSDGATGISIYENLAWTGGDPNPGDKLSYDVYFGTGSPPPMVGTVNHAYYNPDTMNLETTYYWQIVTEDKGGLTATGPIWSFTTSEEANLPPLKPDIYGPPSGSPGKELIWAFYAGDPDDNMVKYNIDWGDGTSTITDYPHDVIEESHTYEDEGGYIIKAVAEDEKGLVSEESEFELAIQKSKSLFHLVLPRIFEWFPNAFPLLRYLLGLKIN